MPSNGDLKTPWVVPQEYGALGDGSHNDHDAFATATAQGKPILVPPGDYVIGGDLVLTSSVRFEAGAVLQPSAGNTITLHGPIAAGRHQIFNVSIGGTIVFGGNAPTEAFPEWWGAKPDGQTDSQPGIQAAIDTLAAAQGGNLVFGTGHYLLGRTIFLRSFVRVEGAGTDTIIENISTLPEDREKSAFQLGNYGPAGTDNTPHKGVSYAVAAGALAGETQITLANSQDAGHFLVGDIVFLFNGDIVHDTETVTEFQQINKVLAINGAVITLRHPLYKDFDGTNPQVVIDRLSGLTALNKPSYVAERVVLSSLAVRASGHRWLESGGGYECLIENIWLDDSQVLMGFQVCAYCIARNVIGTFSDRGVGTAYFTHDCVFDTAVATWAGKSGIRTYRLLIEHHENSHNNVIRNVHVDIGRAVQFSSLVSFSNASEFNVVEYVRIRGDGADLNDYIEFNFDMNIPNVPKQGNVVRWLDIQMTSFKQPQVLISETLGTERKGAPNVLEDCVLLAPNSTNSFLWVHAGSDYEIHRIRTDRYGAVSGGASPPVGYRPGFSLGVRVADVIGSHGANSVRLQYENNGTNDHPTPLVLVGDVFHASNTTPTTITQFVGGWVGKQITVQATNGNTTIQHGTSIFLKGGADKTLAPDETIRLVQFQQDRWDEV